MTATKWVAALAAALVLCCGAPAQAGNLEVREIKLFEGSNTSAAVDTVEQASPWFSVRGASRVYIRVWSANTSAWTAADSIYSDSLTTFKVLFSDSICCTVTGPTGNTIMSAADSLMIDPAAVAANIVADSSFTGLHVKPLPINKPIAAAKSGSGITVTIGPMSPGQVGTTTSDYSGVFPKQYMRIRWEPLRRMTEGGRLSTTGKRTVGIRGLRMRAYVVYANK